jgi:hypothetical protein
MNSPGKMVAGPEPDFPEPDFLEPDFPEPDFPEPDFPEPDFPEVGLEVIVWPNGDKMWFHHDKLHRDDGPAIERASGCRVWYRHGERHREDGPAVERASGDKMWFQHGVFYREDGRCVIKTADGWKAWVTADKLFHRAGGPAVINSVGDRGWFYHGKLHRLDGPAKESADGRREWYVDGIRVTEDTHEAAVEEYLARSSERRVKACRG